MRNRVLAVLGLWCVLFVPLAACGQGPPKAAERPNYQIRGFSMQLNNAQGTKDYLNAIDELANLGCTSINFVMAARQDDVRAKTLAINWKNLPSELEIVRILEHAKKKGMYTILMPIVLLDRAEAKEWRGVIDPPDWDTWFFSYRVYMKTATGIATRAKVDLFCVGSELLSTETKREQWVETIRQIKEIYKGKLTYSANWDHYEVPVFWDLVDYIGMNNYNELASGPGASVKDLNKAWAPIKKKILDFVAEKQKPFLFTEVGWHNLRNTIKEPWNYVVTETEPVDFEEQRRAFQSFVDTWGNVPTNQFMGALIWEWVPGLSGKTKGAYMLKDTPALEVVKKWMAGAKQVKAE